MSEQPQDAATKPTTIAISEDIIANGQLALDELNVVRGHRKEKRITQRAFFEAVFKAGLAAHSPEHPVI